MAFLINMVESMKEIDEELLKSLLQFQPVKLWRNPKRPVLQLLLPYVFFSDVLVQINQIETTPIQNIED